jgi:HSP90 family molecular chaperone
MFFFFFPLYYQFCVPLSLRSRTLAESSPYFEALKQKDVEVLFCYEPHDELVLMQLRQFDSRNLTSVEKEMRQDKEPDDLTDLGKFTNDTIEEFVIHVSNENWVSVLNSHDVDSKFNTFLNIFLRNVEASFPTKTEKRMFKNNAL